MNLSSSLPASFWLPFVDDETLLSSVVSVSHQMRQNVIDHVIRDRLPLNKMAFLQAATSECDHEWPEAKVTIAIRNKHTEDFASRNNLVDYGVTEIGSLWCGERRILYKYLRRTEDDDDDKDEDQVDHDDNSCWDSYDGDDCVELDEEKVRSELFQHGNFFASEEDGRGKRLSVATLGHDEDVWGLSVNFESSPTLRHAVAMTPFADAHPFSVLEHFKRLIAPPSIVGWDSAPPSIGWDSTVGTLLAWRYMRLVLLAEREGRLRATDVRLAKIYDMVSDYNYGHCFEQANIEICLQFNANKDGAEFPLEMYISVGLNSNSIA